MPCCSWLAWLVSLVDVCDTEWRALFCHGNGSPLTVSLVDVCDTEWRVQHSVGADKSKQCHSLMSVILNGG